ncbi:MAG: ROK family protein, partial [Thermoplasmata archaeon]|nr:ROK family protein [Thermoplasmata archaeon]
MPPPVDPDQRMVIGVDVGGTKISAAEVEADGHRRGERTRRHHANAGPDSVVEEILALVSLVHGNSSSRVATVGVGVAAQVDEATGLVHHAPNLGWRDYPLGAKLADSLGVPVAVLNDARAATIAEWRFGAGQGTGDLLVVFV